MLLKVKGFGVEGERAQSRRGMDLKVLGEKALMKMEGVLCGRESVRKEMRNKTEIRKG